MSSIPSAARSSARLRLLPLLATPALVFATALPAASTEAREAAEPVDPAASFQGWDLRGDATLVDLDGEPALRIVGGRAVAPEPAWEDGTIEVEVLLGAGRAFSYLQFRVDEESRGLEEIYLRNHKSELPDALQYTPVDHGRSAWQLYHGEGKTAAVTFAPGEWIPLKVVVEGRRAAVFLGETETGAEPDLIVRRLGRTPRPGTIALRGFVTRDSSADTSATFRRLRVSPGRVDFDFSSVEPPPPPPDGTIERWSVGASFSPEEMTVDSLDAVPAASRTPQRQLSVDPEGLLDLGAAMAVPPDADSWAAVASVTVHAERATRARLDLGYSDAVSVFLNGEPLFSADDRFSTDAPRRQGLLGLFQSTLHLPLREGANRLELVVADVFGGWGLTGRLEGEGVTVGP